MKKAMIALGLVMVMFLGASSLYAQMESPKGERGRPGPLMAPPGSGIAALSPDSKFVYVVFKDKLFQYEASDLKLRKSIYVGSSTERGMPPIGGSIFFSQDSKRVYIMQGNKLLLFDAIELTYINSATLE